MPRRQINQRLHHLLQTILLEALRLLADEVCECPEHVFSISCGRRAILDLIALRLENHEQNLGLYLVAGLNEGVDAVAYDEGGEEDEDGYGDLNWNHFVFRVITIKAHRLENAHEELVKHTRTQIT